MALLNRSMRVPMTTLAAGNFVGMSSLDSRISQSSRFGMKFGAPGAGTLAVWRTRGSLSGRGSQQKKWSLGRIMNANAMVDSPTGGAEDWTPENERLLLKKKAADVAPFLSGSSVFLVGMSRSGKTTVGKTLSESLGYYFFDSKQLVEAAAGETISEMVEDELQSAETEVLMQLSPLVRLVVATGDSAVTSTRNWSYLRNGVTVWLDVPVESLAKRIAEDSDAAGYEKAVENLQKVLGERAEYYANADAVVSIQKIAEEKNISDVSEITPAMVAYYVLEKIDNVLKEAKKVKK